MSIYEIKINVIVYLLINDPILVLQNVMLLLMYKNIKNKIYFMVLTNIYIIFILTIITHNPLIIIVDFINFWIDFIIIYNLFIKNNYFI